MASQLDIIRANTFLDYTIGVRLDQGAEITSLLDQGISATHDGDAAFAQCALPLGQPYTFTEGRHRIDAYAGWIGRDNPSVRANSALFFVGEISAKQDTYFVPGTRVQAGGFLKRLEEPIGMAIAFYYDGGTADETQALLDQVPLDSEAYPIKTDADIIIKLLELHGITPQTTNHHIEASPLQVARLVPIFVEPTQSFYSIIQKLDEASPNHRTFDDRNGAVTRKPIFGSVPSGVRATFTENDILDLDVSIEYQVYNQVIVEGATNETEDDVVTGISPVGDASPSPYIPSPPGTRTSTLRNDYIETVDEAQRVADDLLGRLKQPLQTATLTVLGCPDLYVGDGVRVESSRWTSNAFIVAHTLAEQGDRLISTLRLRGSAAAEPRPNQPPTAAFTYRVVTEQVIVGGEEQPIAFITITSVSADSDGEIVSLVLTVGADTYTLNLATPVITIAYVGTPPVNATLTATDDGGLSDQETQQITWDITTAIVEPIALAEQEDGAYSADGDQTWETFSGDVISVPPIRLLGAKLYSGANGEIWRWEDDAETPTLTQTLPAAVNCLWKNEKIENRAVAGLENGHVWLSIDDGVTWTKQGTLPAAINDISESPELANNGTASSGESHYTTFDWLTFTPTITVSGAVATRHAAGFAALYGGFSTGAVVKQPIDGSSATTISGISGSVRGLTLGVLAEQMFVATDHSGAGGYSTHYWTPNGGLIAGPPLPTAANHAIRSGEVPGLIYAGTDGAFVKVLEQQVYEARIMTGSQRCLKVGYSPPATPPMPPPSVELVWLPNAATNDKIWWWNGTTIIERTPPVAARRWQGIDVDRNNANRWLIWGGTRDHDPYATLDGRLIAKDDLQDPIWLSEDSGISWVPHVITPGADPLFNIGTSWKTVYDPLWAMFTRTSGDIAVGVGVAGIAKDGINRPLTEIGIWRNGTRVMSSESRLVSMQVWGFAPGQDDDIVAVIDTTNGTSTRNTYVGYVDGTGWHQVGGDYPTFYPDLVIEPGTRRAVARNAYSGSSDTGLLVTTDYRTTMLGLVPPPYTGTHDGAARQQSLAWGADAIYTTPQHLTVTDDHNGLIVIDPDTPASDQRLYTSGIIGRVTVARQSTQQAAAVELPDNLYGVYDGTWTEVPGPAGVPSTQIASAFAVIQRGGGSPGGGGGATITSPTTINAVQGGAISYQIIASDGSTSYSATGLPSGLSLNSSTGVISGSVTTAGTYSITVATSTASTTVQVIIQPVVAPPDPGLPPPPIDDLQTFTFTPISISAADIPYRNGAGIVARHGNRWSSAPYQDTFAKIDWNKINPSKNTFSRSAIESELAKNPAYTLTFGPVALFGGEWSGQKIPQYVINEGRTVKGSDNLTYPNYNDATVRAYIKEMWEWIESEFGDDPRIFAILDLMFGRYGEGKTYGGFTVSTANQEALAVNMHDAITSKYIIAPSDNSTYWLAHHNAGGAGWFRHSLGNPAFTNINSLYSGGSPFWDAWKTQPVAGVEAYGSSSATQFATAKTQVPQYHIYNYSDHNMEGAVANWNNLSSQQQADWLMAGKLAGPRPWVESISVSGPIVAGSNTFVIKLHNSDETDSTPRPPILEPYTLKYRLMTQSGIVVWTGSSSFNGKTQLPTNATAVTHTETITVSSLPDNTYILQYALIDERSGTRRKPFGFANSGRQGDGWYVAGAVRVGS